MSPAPRSPASRFPTRFPVGNVPYTVSIRLLPGEQGEQVDALHWGDLSDPTKSFRLFVNGCPRSIYAACGGNEWLKTGRTHSYVVNADAWKHYVVTYKAGVVTVYRDGKQTDRITGATSALVASDLWLNCVKAHTSANTCYLDDVCIYDVALTKDEVAVLSRSLKTGLSGAVVSAETSLKVDAGATVNAQGGRIGVKGLNGAGVVSLTGGTTLAVDDMSAFSGSVSGAGCLKLSGSTQATIGCPVELAENGTFASTGGVTPCVETSRRVIVPETGRLAFDAVPHGLVKQVIAKGSELMLPSSFNGWSCTFADGETTRVKFFAEDGESVSWFTIQYPDREGKARGTGGDAHNVFDCRYNLFNPRLDAVMYYTMINGIAVKRFADEVKYDDGVQAFLFRDDADRSFLVLWREGVRVDCGLPLPTAEEIELTRIDGSHSTLVPGDGVVTLGVGPEPVMLRYRDRAAKLPRERASAALAVDPRQDFAIRKGGGVTVEITGPGLKARDLVAELPPRWRADFAEREASVLMTVTAPAETRARTGRVTVRRRTESGVSAEITLEFPVES